MTLQPEYDFRALRGVVRGKYAARYREGLRVVRLAKDVAGAFADEAAVNEALREYLRGLPAVKPPNKVPMFEILPALPVYGPLAEPFTPTGQGQQREGLVVRFTSTNGESWVGNFQRGLTAFDEVVKHPNGREAIVVAGGQAYVVDPDDRSRRNYFGGDIEATLAIPEMNAVVFGNGLWFEAIGADSLLWRSARISWDGMQGLCREGMYLQGQAWSPVENRWLSFEVDLVSGSFSGGSYIV